MRHYIASITRFTVIFLLLIPLTEAPAQISYETESITIQGGANQTGYFYDPMNHYYGSEVGPAGSIGESATSGSASASAAIDWQFTEDFTLVVNSSLFASSVVNNGSNGTQASVNLRGRFNFDSTTMVTLEWNFTGNILFQLIPPGPGVPWIDSGGEWGSSGTYSYQVSPGTNFLFSMQIYEVAPSDIPNGGTIPSRSGTGMVTVSMETVPEPSTWALIGIGLLTLGWTLWGRRVA